MAFEKKPRRDMVLPVREPRRLVAIVGVAVLAVAVCSSRSSATDRQPELARQQYELAVKYQPHFAIYRNGLAASLARLNRAQKAFIQWHQAAADDPNYIDPHNNLGDMLLELNRRDDARREYHSALQIDPNNAYALARLKEIGG